MNLAGNAKAFWLFTELKLGECKTSFRRILCQRAALLPVGVQHQGQGGKARASDPCFLLQLRGATGNVQAEMAD